MDASQPSKIRKRGRPRKSVPRTSTGGVTSPNLKVEEYNTFAGTAPPTTTTALSEAAISQEDQALINALQGPIAPTGTSTTEPSVESPATASHPTPRTPQIPKAGLLTAQAILETNRRAEELSRAVSWKESMSIRKAAAKWGGSKSSIARHLKALKEGGQPYASDKLPGRPRTLTKEEETALAAFCVYLAQGNCMGNIPMVHTAANELRYRRTPPMGPCNRRWVVNWLMGREDLMLSRIPRPDKGQMRRIEGDEDSVVKEFFNKYYQDRREMEEQGRREMAEGIAVGQ